jgi:hypothetical protein
MPFTFSHPAIVLPLLKLCPKYACASALIIGSMSPDFEFFIRMRLIKEHGHSIAGAFYFDLPVTLLSLFLFHLLVRDSLIRALPEYLRLKYSVYLGLDWISYARKNWLIVVVSALVGIFSHIFWDAFTHAPGYFVRYIPYLQQTILVFNVPIPSYDLLQLLSSFIGGVLILAYLLWPGNEVLKGQAWGRTIRYILLVIVIALVVVWLRDPGSYNEFVATILSGGLIGMMIAPFFLNHLVKLKINKAKRD